jgi:hypothetical protein
MFVDHMLRTIEGSQKAELGQLGTAVSRAYAEGAIVEGDHQRLWEAIDARRAVIKPTPKHAPQVPRRRSRSPERQRSLDRRRSLADWALPGPLKARFTTGEKAALLIIGVEAVQHGACVQYIEATAARAGVCRTTVQNAIREARRLGLIIVTERRRRGQRSLANVIRIVSREWRLWLTRGSGFKKMNTTVTSVSKSEKDAGLGARWQGHWRHYDPADRSSQWYRRSRKRSDDG